MEFRHIGCFEWHCATDHRIEQNAQTPEINCESSVALISDDLRRNIGWRATLIFNKLIFSDDFTDSKVTDLDSEVSINENVI